MRSQLPPMKQVARMVKSHLPNILTYYAHRVTNAVSEGINSAIQTIKKRVFGFRNPDNFKTAIYFHCGGLELYPEEVRGSRDQPAMNRPSTASLRRSRLPSRCTP